MKLEDQLIAPAGLGIVVGICLGLFYADDNAVGSWDLGWLQGAMSVLIGLLPPYGLVANVAKYKDMKC